MCQFTRDGHLRSTATSEEPVFDFVYSPITTIEIKTHDCRTMSSQEVSQVIIVLTRCCLTSVPERELAGLLALKAKMCLIV